MKENTMRLAAAVVLTQHITTIGAISPKGALAKALFPCAALKVNCTMLPVGWPDAPREPANSEFTSPAESVIIIATRIQRSLLADVDQSRDFGIR